ncbi:MAG: hypothetical protein AAGU27_22825 [Dehalobacterium sp.]
MTEQNKAALAADFNRWCHNFGRLSNLFLVIMMTSIPFIICTVYDVHPSWAAFWPACVTVVLILAPFWVGECIGYMPLMGPGALYLSYITGNVTNLKMPSTVNTLQILGLNPGSDEANAVAILAAGASALTVTVVLFLGIFLAAPLAPILKSEALAPGFNNVIPALFGGLVASSVMGNKIKFKMWLAPVAVSFFFALCTNVSSAYYMLIAIAVSVLVGYFFIYKPQAAIEAKAAETKAENA